MKILVHSLASDRDPAGFGSRKTQFMNEYETASETAASALLAGASVKTALDGFRRDMERLYPDRELSPSVMRKLRWDLKRRWVRHAIDVLQREQSRVGFEKLPAIPIVADSLYASSKLG
jgi:hypothetical protein